MTRRISCQAGSRWPTGSRVLRIRPDPSARSRPGEPATSISRRHQPSGRHSSGSTIRTACTRRSGMVSATVPSSPRRIRMPSGDCASVNPYSVASRRHTMGTRVTRKIRKVPPVAASTGRPHQDHHELRHQQRDEQAGPGGQHRPGQPPGGDAGQDPLTGFRGGRVEPVMRGQQAGPQLERGLLGQVGQTSVGVAGAGQPDAQFGQSERAGQERPHHVYRLDPGHRQLPGVAAQQAGLDPQRGPVQLPAGDQPVDHGRDHRHHGQPPVVQVRPVVAELPGRGDAHDGQHPDRGPAGAHERRQRVQPVPLAGHVPGRAGHRPAAFASPRAASRSRSRAASSRSSPGIRASLAAAAVCSLTVASRNARSTGPAVTSTNCIRP